MAVSFFIPTSCVRWEPNIQTNVRRHLERRTARFRHRESEPFPEHPEGGP